MKKKISLLFANCLLLSATAFAQNDKKVKDFLAYEPHIVVKKDSNYTLVNLQSFKVLNTKVEIKGLAICKFDLINLEPANITKTQTLFYKEVSVNQIWVSQNGGLDKNNKRIWIALNLANLVGVSEYIEDDYTFDYPQF